jgi:hypothetical protein
VLATAHKATPVGVTLPLVPTSYFAHAKAHSRATSHIFAPVTSHFQALSTFAHFFRIPTLFGHTTEPAISVTASPTFALVVVGS